jgi:6-phosphogluconolactonase (cycloisomerase 2 family)
MRSIAKLGIVAGIAIATAAAAITAFAGSAGAAQIDFGPQPRAVFVLTDGLAGNAVVAYDRAANGTLTLAHSYPTGGTGGRLGTSVADHTASEGSLTYDSARELLYAVNAGSNSVSVFRVRGDQLTKIQTVTSGGTFPVSIAASGPFVYVLNALNGGSVQGYLATGFGLIPVAAWNRSLGLPTTTPTAQAFTVPPAQALFSPDGHQLLVTTKGGTNSVIDFRVSILGISAPVINPLPTGSVPFGATFDHAGHLVVIGAADTTLRTFALSATGHLTPVGTPVAVGQAGSCWVTTNGKYLFVSNAGAGTETAFSTTAAGQLTNLGSAPVDAGTVDAAATPDGNWLYVQGGANGTVTGFRIANNGTLTKVGATLVVPGAAGGEGIVAL